MPGKNVEQNMNEITGFLTTSTAKEDAGRCRGQTAFADLPYLSQLYSLFSEKEKSFQRNILKHLKCHSAECLSQWEWTHCYWKNLGAGGVAQNTLLRVERKELYFSVGNIELIEKTLFSPHKYIFLDDITFFWHKLWAKLNPLTPEMSW